MPVFLFTKTYFSIFLIKTMNLTSLSATDLLAYKDFADTVYNFYDNEAKANSLDNEVFKEAYNNSLKYLEIKSKIFNEIKNRVDKLSYE